MFSALTCSRAPSESIIGTAREGIDHHDHGSSKSSTFAWHECVSLQPLAFRSGHHVPIPEIAEISGATHPFRPVLGVSSLDEQARYVRGSWPYLRTEQERYERSKDATCCPSQRMMSLGVEGRPAFEPHPAARPSNPVAGEAPSVHRRVGADARRNRAQIPPSPGDLFDPPDLM